MRGQQSTIPRCTPSLRQSRSGTCQLHVQLCIHHLNWLLRFLLPDLCSAGPQSPPGLQEITTSRTPKRQFSAACADASPCGTSGESLRRLDACCMGLLGFVAVVCWAVSGGLACQGWLPRRRRHPAAHQVRLEVALQS
jgi:hypothetical protein